jgi:N-acetylglutamate synthase-like GNAT family acetyltransferase
MNFKIVKANERHRGDINRLLRETKISNDYDGPLTNFWVAKVGDRVVGCGGFDVINDSAACLIHLAVEKEFRKQGIASALINKKIEEARKRDIHRLALCTMYYRFNFFKRRGFRVVRRADLPEDLKSYSQFTEKRYMKCAVMVNV